MRHLPLLFTALLLTITAAHAKPPLNLVPASGSPPTAKVVALNQNLLDAARADDLEEVKRLLHAGADINVIEDYSKTHTPLTCAASNGHLRLTRFLLAHGADPNGNGVYLSPLFWTVASGQTEAVRLLLQNGANPYHPCVDGNPAIVYAVDDGHLPIVQLLLWRMPRLSKAKKKRYWQEASDKALSLVIFDGPPEAVKAVLDLGAEVNSLVDHDEFGEISPLMCAASRGSIPILQMLLAKGARVNQRTVGNRTALMYAAGTDMNTRAWQQPSPTLRRHPRSTSARLLLQSGAQINARDSNGMTALMYAAQGNWRVTELLLKHGVDIRTRDDMGRTALHWAAAYRDARSIQILLNHGAQLEARDIGGTTPLMQASVKPDSPSTWRQRADRAAAIHALRRAGANPRLQDHYARNTSVYGTMTDYDFVDVGN